VESAAKLITTVAPKRAQKVTGEACRVKTAQGSLYRFGITDYNRKLLRAAIRGTEGDDASALGSLKRQARFANRSQA
jgi:glyceraldehyde-3-phosphate dehydrogenase/erythrose-4-phosphate dehydrogenase